MIEIDKTILSSEIVSTSFVCDIKACKGACCVEGDAGAPLEEKELSILDDEFSNIKPFLRKEGIEAIRKQGKYQIDVDGDYVTPLVNEKECAYVIFEEDGISKCGIEKAYENGVTSFKKPISCHLYPIRVSKYKKFTAINYHEWEICKPAKIYGEQNEISLIKFLKEPLIRKFGKEWYNKLEKEVDS